MFDEKTRKSYCDAGRVAFLGGKWVLPCPADVDRAGRIHVIYAGNVASSDVAKIELCDAHFDEVNRLGLVTEPYVGRDGVRERIGQEPD